MSDRAHHEQKKRARSCFSFLLGQPRPEQNKNAPGVFFFCSASSFPFPAFLNRNPIEIHGILRASCVSCASLRLPFCAVCASSPMPAASPAPSLLRRRLAIAPCIYAPPCASCASCACCPAPPESPIRPRCLGLGFRDELITCSKRLNRLSSSMLLIQAPHSSWQIAPTRPSDGFCKPPAAIGK